MSVPGGESSSAAVLDTATTAESALPAADAPVESTGDAEVVEGQPSGDLDSSATTPESDDSAEDVDDAADEGTTEEEKKLSRRERQRLREEQRIADAVAAKVAEREAEQQRQSEARQRQEAAEAAQRQRQERLEKYIGTPDAPDKPGTLTTLRSEIDQINRQIRAELVNPQGADLDALTAQVAEKEARVERLTEAQGMAGEIENHIWDQIEADFMAAAGFPEFADDAARDKYRRAPGGIKGALSVLRQTIRSAVESEWQAKLTASEKKAKAEHEAMTADRNAWRAKAGGQEDAPMQGGTPASIGELTLARYNAMTTEERRKITPAQRDAMMARHLADQRNGRRAG